MNLNWSAQSTPIPFGDHLSISQMPEIAKLQAEYSNVFSPLLGHTSLLEHHIEMPSGVVVCSHCHRLPEHKKQVVWKELMAQYVVNKVSHSDANQVVLVPKAAGLVWFCVVFITLQSMWCINLMRIHWPTLPQCGSLLFNTGFVDFSRDFGRSP